MFCYLDDQGLARMPIFFIGISRWAYRIFKFVHNDQAQYMLIIFDQNRVWFDLGPIFPRNHFEAHCYKTQISMKYQIFN